MCLQLEMDVVLTIGINLAPEDRSHMTLGDSMLTVVSQQNCLKIIQALDWIWIREIIISYEPQPKAGCGIFSPISVVLMTRLVMKGFIV